MMLRRVVHPLRVSYASQQLVLRTLSTNAMQSSSVGNADSTTLSTPGTFISTRAGSRTFELCRPESGNALDNITTSYMSTHVKKYMNNGSVVALLFASTSLDMFSQGITPSLNTNEHKASLHEMIATIGNIKKAQDKASIVVYNGILNGTSYAAFADCEYKLACPDFSFSMNEIMHNMLPLGGIAYHFNKALPGDTGIALCRFLAISGCEVRGDSMHRLGLVTHLVEDKAHDSLTHALSHTHLTKIEEERAMNSGNMGGVQGSRHASIRTLIDIMHVGDPEGIDSDPMQHPIWEQMMLVPPKRWDTLPTPTSSFDEKIEDFDVADHTATITAVFKEHSIDTVMSLLGEVDEDWAKEAKMKMQDLDKSLVEQWWKHTQKVQDDKLDLTQTCQLD